MIKKGMIVKIINLGIFSLFVLLIYKDPFSQRTLIPNFEPFPDTFNYINPALNLNKGEGFNLSREGRSLTLTVPPLYSLSLVPFFIIKPDPRMAYYTNIVLAFISLSLFWSILKQVLTNKILIFSILILYITNYFVYWVPSIVMAENLMLTLFLATLYLMFLKTSFPNLVLMAFFAVGLYATKFSTLPISLSITFFYIVKVWIENTRLKQKLKTTSLFILAILIFYLFLGIVEWVIKGNNIFFQIFAHLLEIYNSIFQSSTISKTISGTESLYTSSWFGVEYIGKNLPAYINSLIGQPNRFLWDSTPLLPNFIAMPGLVGILLGIFVKKNRFISLLLILLMFGLISFMSTFYTFDARYIYVIIPMLLIGFGLFLTKLCDLQIKSRVRLNSNFLVIAIIIIYLVINLTRIKSQVSLNLKYAETPWYYISVLKMNEYFTQDKIKNNKNPVLISALPPFLIDYYTNGNYTLLPLSYEQEFRGQEVREKVWGPNDYSDLPKLYTKYLNGGFDVYVSRAGLGNEGYTNRDFNTIVEKFDTKLVLPGCYDQCNIYSVKLKEENGN